MTGGGAGGLMANHTLDDLMWVLVCAALVMLMQAGFCCLESGLVRAKNSVNVALKNLISFSVSSVMFWLVGFGLMFGASYDGLVGTSRFAFGDTAQPWLLAFFVFELVFCGTATTLISGAVAERVRFVGYLAVPAVTASMIYPVVGHWIWGGVEAGIRTGWLGRSGFIDFAGATAVPSVGGWVALAMVVLIGPRLGRFGRDGAMIHGHDVPMAALGAVLLWFGWFGFNGGSTLGVSDRIPLIFVNTGLAGAFGGVAAVMLSWLRFGRVSVAAAINGVLGGLVAITASCHIMAPIGAAAIGAVAGLLALVGKRVLDRLEIDDTVSVIPVHLFAGVWGTLAVAIRGDPGAWGTGMGRWEQLGVQAAGVLAAGSYAFAVAFAAIWALNRVMPLRVRPEEEVLGLNVTEHGARTAMVDLLADMDDQRRAGNVAARVRVEPHTEVGRVASEYNRVLDRAEKALGAREASEKLLRTLRSAQARFMADTAPDVLFDELLGELLPLTESEYGFIGEVLFTDSGAPYLKTHSITNIAWDQETRRFYEKYAPQGLEFYNLRTLFGAAITTGKPVVANDPATDPRRGGLPAGHPPLRAFLGLPFRQGDRVVGMVGIANRPGGYDWETVDFLQPFLETCAHIIEAWRNDTRRREAEEALRRARDEALEATRLKSEFLANMSHELRTPMNGIITMTDLTLDTELAAEQREYLTIVKGSATDLLRLLNDILDFSKIEAGKLDLEQVPFRLRDRLDEALRPLALRAEMKGLGFACEIAADVPAVVVGDPGRLQQVLVNLVGNAIKFTHGGNLDVRVVLESQSEGAVALRASVRDTGIGIPADKQRSIFGAFTQADGSTTRQYGGTGLGLAICAQLVQRMGGRIWVESAAGRGSTFQFIVPFQVPARDRRALSGNGEAGREPMRVGGGGDQRAAGAELPALRILLAEDNPINRLAMTRLLEKRGCLVVAVENGREALAAFDREPIDLVLMDVQMPDLDGLEATAALRARERGRGTRVPVIALTAHAMQGDRERCLVAGMDEYVTKPVQPEELLAVIGRAVQRRAGPQEAESASPPPGEVLRHETLRANTGDDRVLLREIVDIFRIDGPRALAEIRDGLRIRDVWIVERAAHRLKGSLATFGAFAAHAVAERVVMAARGGDVDEARAAFVALDGELQRLAQELDTAADRSA